MTTPSPLPRRGLLGANLALLAGMGAPVGWGHLNTLLPGAASLVTALIIGVCSALAAWAWTGAARQANLPSQAVSSCLRTGIQDAATLCFSGLWLVPRSFLHRVCVLRWSRNVLRHGATVQTALISSFSAVYLVMGLAAMLIASIAMAEEGWWFTALAVVASWISTVQLFHWLVRRLLISKPLFLPRPTYSECNAAFASRACARALRR